MSSAAGTAAVDVLVVGAGPAGASAATWLAREGHQVVLLERKAFPRGKTCGGAITPAAVRELIDLGLSSELDGLHRHHGVTLVAGERTRDVDWPSHPVLPRYGVTVRRRSFDEVVARHAATTGADLREEHEAIEPIVERGFVRGARVRGPHGLVELRARYVVVADGGNSRFGRRLGTFRRPNWPSAVAARTYFDSGRHDADRIELSIALPDREGAALPAFGWVFPLGDGTVNVGVELLSTAPDARSINIGRLLEAYATEAAVRWDFDPRRPVELATSRIPLGGSVAPEAGPTFLVVGDAAGAASAFTGEGIGAALCTGRAAAEVLHQALDADDPTVLQRYPRLIDERRGDHLRTSRFVARTMGHPRMAEQIAKRIVGSRRFADWSLRIAASELRTDRPGAAEMAARVLSTVARLSPDP